MGGPTKRTTHMGPHILAKGSDTYNLDTHNPLFLSLADMLFDLVFNVVSAMERKLVVVCVEQSQQHSRSTHWKERT